MKIDWVKVTGDAPWRPRDSQGECVHNDRLWLFGGWFDSYEAAPRDVWCSSDGERWQLVQPQAPWVHSDLPMSVTFDNRMWMMGGWCNGRLPGCSAGNEVWCSTDGVAWRQATAAAAWSPRLAAGIVVFDQKMWILGGIGNYLFGDDHDLKNDVWCSPDGRDWSLVTRDAGWSPRAFHQAAVFNGKIWVLGGGNYTPGYHAHHDVWCSADGVNWSCVTEAAAWEPRLWFSSVVYRDHLWVLGGWSQPHDNYGDAWCSKDGSRWVELKSRVMWTPRHEHSALVFKDRVWVVGGHARPLSNEVWCLQLPIDWTPGADRGSADSTGGGM